MAIEADVTAAETNGGGPGGRASAAMAVPLGTRHQLFPDQPLPAFNADGALAYRAVSPRDAPAEFFALVCDRGLPARFDVALQLVETDPTGLVELVNAGPVDWPPARGRRLAVVYARPAGARVMKNLVTPREPMPEDVLVATLLRPAVSALRNLATRGIGHGSVRPDNMFFADLAGAQIRLGDCVTAPSGYGQPAMFETIERAQAAPTARGGGAWSDDLFALGVSTLWLALGQNPVPEFDEATLLAQRLDRGSYATYVANARLQTGLHEILRALLADDPRQRPSPKEMELWLTSRRIAVRQIPTPKRAARPLEFDGDAYAVPRHLAHAIAASPGLAAPLIESGDLERWMRRSVMDDERADVVHAAYGSNAGPGGLAAASPDRLVARTLAAIDPAGPIRFKGLAFLPSGLGMDMQAAMAAGRDARAHVEALSGGLPSFWVGAQPGPRPELKGLVQILDQMRLIAERGVAGYGAERVMYELCPQAPCLSPILGGGFVATPQELLVLLDEIGQRAGRPNEPMDSHVAGFLMARHKKIDDRHFLALGPGGTPAKRALAILAVLADTQRQFGPEALRGLCRWMMPAMRPAVERYRSADIRRRLSEELTRVVETGDLTKMLTAVDDPKALRDDGKAFDGARARYVQAAEEIETLQRSVANPLAVARTDGRQVTAVISSVVAAMVVFAIVARAVGP